MTDARHDDAVADDISSRNPDSGDVVAGEQVLDEGKVAPDPDDFGAAEGAEQLEESGADDETAAEKRHAADERTDPGAPPAQPEGAG